MISVCFFSSSHGRDLIGHGYDTVNGWLKIQKQVFILSLTHSDDVKEKCLTGPRRHLMEVFQVESDCRRNGICYMGWKQHRDIFY